MLRTLLGEKPRVNQGKLKEAMDTMAFTLESFENKCMWITILIMIIGNCMYGRRG